MRICFLGGSFVNGTNVARWKISARRLMKLIDRYGALMKDAHSLAMRAQ
jgi:hypothetical protein